MSFAPPGQPLESKEPEPSAAPAPPRIGQLTPEEREAALRNPGQSWRDWFYGVALKWWIGLGIVIVDSWIVAGWVEVAGWLELAGSLAIAIYLEYLLFQYLWHPYQPEFHGKFRRSWKTPFEVGRWIPERRALLAGTLEPSTPDPHQFL